MANKYESWNGVGMVTDSKIFSAPGHEVDPDDYPAIKDYLPPKPSSTTKHYFVARVATTSRKVPDKDVVKIFGNSSWSSDVLRELERLEFEEGDDENHLVSDDDIDLVAGDWVAKGKVEIFRALVPGKPMAKIAFSNESADENISTFWCWPE